MAPCGAREGTEALAQAYETRSTEKEHLAPPPLEELQRAPSIGTITARPNADRRCAAGFTHRGTDDRAGGEHGVMARKGGS